MSYREQRRAKKARKNLAMYKLAGRRPWLPLFDTGCTLQWAANSASNRVYRNEETFYGGYYEDDNHNIHMSDFRERSGFLTMSRRADEVQF